MKSEYKFVFTGEEAAEALARFIDQTRPNQWPFKYGDAYTASIDVDPKTAVVTLEVKKGHAK
jgi:hypothetical protein